MEYLQKNTLKRYWRRKQYQRLHKKDVKVTRLGGGSPRFWRIKAIPKLRWKIVSPVKLLTKLKNAYMNMMVKLAGSVGYLNTDNTFGGKRIPKARKVGNDFDDRLIYEIYKNIIAENYLAKHENGNGFHVGF